MTKRELVSQWLEAAYRTKEQIMESYPDVAPFGVPASTSVCQAILESGYGQFVPMDVTSGHFSYNLFGIKGQGPIGAVQCWTYEWNGTRYVRELAAFRAYRDYEQSFEDHGLFFVENPRYHPCLQVANDPRAFAQCIAKAGYATGPNYAQKLIAIGESWTMF